MMADDPDIVRNRQTIERFVPYTVLVIGSVFALAVLLVFIGWAVSTWEMNSGPPVKDAMYYSSRHELSAIIPDLTSRVLIIKGLPYSGFKDIKNKTGKIEPTDNVIVIEGKSYPVLFCWNHSKRQQSNSVVGGGTAHVATMGGPEIGYRGGFRWSDVPETASKEIAMGNAAIIVVTNSNEVYYNKITVDH